MTMYIDLSPHTRKTLTFTLDVQCPLEAPTASASTITIEIGVAS
jgi:hypothetical protein